MIKKSIMKFFLGMVAVYLVACNQSVTFDLPQASDNFGQKVTYNNKVDIVWILDNSSSMARHQRNLTDQVPQLVETLNAIKMDYHMAVITTSMGGDFPDGGKFIGSPAFLTKNTPNLSALLAQRMLVGEKGSNNERGLESLVTALSPSHLSNNGRGFLRDDALLVVIALSDEEDKSPKDNVAQVTRFLDNLKRPWVDGSRSWMFSFIGILGASSNCSTFNEYYEIGYRYIELANLTNGVKESICTDNFSNAVSNIRARVLEVLTEFKLSAKPLVETIEVRINGKLIPQSSTNGWVYLESRNSIRFYGTGVPPADASVKVDFKPREAN